MFKEMDEASETKKEENVASEETTEE
jgi:hypothetical protein